MTLNSIDTLQEIRFASLHSEWIWHQVLCVQMYLEKWFLYTMRISFFCFYSYISAVYVYPSRIASSGHGAIFTPFRRLLRVVYVNAHHSPCAWAPPKHLVLKSPRGPFYETKPTFSISGEFPDSVNLNGFFLMMEDKGWIFVFKWTVRTIRSWGVIPDKLISSPSSSMTHPLREHIWSDEKQQKSRRRIRKCQSLDVFLLGNLFFPLQMKQDRLVACKRSRVCLKRQQLNSACGVGGIISNVLKKRNGISRSAPRLLCTLEPGHASQPVR